MSRDSGGTYFLPAGNPVTPDTIIESAWANTTMPDLGNELTNSLDRSGRGGMLAPLKISDGTTATPGLNFTQDPNNGLFRSAPDTWHLVAGGVILGTVGPSAVSFPTLNATYVLKAGDTMTGPLGIVGANSGTVNSLAFSYDVGGNYKTGFAIQSAAGSGVGNVLHTRISDGTQAGQITVLSMYGSGDAIFNGQVGIGRAPVAGYSLAAQLKINSLSDVEAQTGFKIMRESRNDQISFGSGSTFSSDGSLVANYGLTFQPSSVAGGVGLAAFGPLEFFTGQVKKLYLGVDGQASFTNNVSATGLSPRLVDRGGALTGEVSATFAQGQSQKGRMTGNVNLTFSSIPEGSVLRFMIYVGGSTLTVPSVFWPDGVTPNFGGGPNRWALLVITNVDATLWGNASLY